MKKAVFAVLIGVLMLIPSVTQAQYWTGNANLFLGVKNLDKDDWEPVDEHYEFGILVDFGKTNWPVNFAVDFLASSTSETLYLVDFDASTTEINLGVRKAFGDVFRPYIGGGLAMISGKLEASTFGIGTSDSDSGMGFWLNGGVYMTIGTAFNVGLDLRYSSAKATIFGYDAKVGGVHAGLVVGFHW